jgi:hypothetical protein
LGLGLLADFLQDIRGVLGCPDQYEEKAQGRQDHQGQKALAQGLAEAGQAPAQGDGVENPREPEGDKAAKAQVKKGLKEALNAYMFNAYMFPWF